MKRLSLAVTIAAVSMGLMGCTNSNATNTSNKITIEQAKEIALKHAGLTKNQVAFFETENSIDNGLEKYNIEFYCNGKEYDYEISSVDGSIIQYDNDIDEDNNQNNSQASTQNGSESKPQNNSQVSTQNSSESKPQNNSQVSTQNNSVNNVPNNTPSNANNTGGISLEKAKQIALSHAGLSSNQVTFVQAKKDFDDGIQKYEIEFYYNGKEYDYEINAINGQIIKYDFDMEYNYTPNNNQSNTQSTVNNTNNTQSTVTNTTKISAEKAKQIALSHAGLTSSQVTFTKTELDFDDGIQKYDVEFYYNHREYSYEINANTGAILSYEQD